MPRGLRVPLVGELDPEYRRMARGHELEARILFHVLGILTIEGEANIRLARLQHRDACSAFRHALHREPLHVGYVPPVPRVSLQHDLDARRVTYELVGTGTDRMLL